MKFIKYQSGRFLSAYTGCLNEFGYSIDVWNSSKGENSFSENRSANQS